jgi:TOBE domain
VEYLVAAEGGELLVRTQALLDCAPGDRVTLSFAAEKTVALLQA